MCIIKNSVHEMYRKQKYTFLEFFLFDFFLFFFLFWLHVSLSCKQKFCMRMCFSGKFFMPHKAHKFHAISHAHILCETSSCIYLNKMCPFLFIRFRTLVANPFVLITKIQQFINAFQSQSKTFFIISLHQIEANKVSSDRRKWWRECINVHFHIGQQTFTTN